MFNFLKQSIQDTSCTSNKFQEEINTDKLIEYLLKRNIENFLNNSIPEEQPLSNMVVKLANLPELGSHLKTPRTGYTHHGIYIGDEKVIHYSGLANSIESGPIEEISLSEFDNTKGFEIILHPHSKYSPQEIVNRAYSRLGEASYNVINNNCEHFVNWCIYDTSHSKQVENSIIILSKIHPLSKNVVSSYYSFKHIKSYLNKKISKEKLFDELSETIFVTASSTLYAVAGQTAIPIPVLGGLVGATVGFILGSMLHNSGLIALGESSIVRISRARREKIEQMCRVLIPVIQENRVQLGNYIDKYFSERKQIFTKSFALMDQSLQLNSQELFLEGLEEISKQFNKNIKYKNQKEFDRAFYSDESLKL